MRLFPRAVGAALLSLALTAGAQASDVNQWSGTAANNSAPAPNGWTTGTMRPNEVSPTAREMMAATRRDRDRDGATVTSGGAANVQTLTFAIPPTAYVAGDRFSFIAGFSNTGATTVNVNGLGAKAVKIGSADLTGGEIVAGRVVTVIYDGVNFQLAAGPPPPPSTTTLGGVKSSAAVANQFLTGLSTNGSLTRAQPDCSDLAGQEYCRKRNYFVNPAIQVDQRQSASIQATGYSVAQNIPTTSYIADMWRYTGLPLGSAVTLRRHGGGDATWPTGQYTLYFAKTTAGGAPPVDSANGIWHDFSAGDVLPFRLGTGAAKRASMGFWVYTSHSINLPVRLSSRGFTNHRSYYWNCATTANQWTHCTDLNFLMDTINSDTCTNGLGAPNYCWWPIQANGQAQNQSGMHLFIPTAANKTGAPTTPKTWVYNRNPVLATADLAEEIPNFSMYLTGFQLVEGSTLPPFEVPRFDDDLNDSQRFYQQSYLYGISPSSLGATLSLSGRSIFGNPSKSTTESYETEMLSRTMACLPSVTLYNPANNTPGQTHWGTGGAPPSIVIEVSDKNFVFRTISTSPSVGEYVDFHWKAECNLGPS